MKPITMQLKAFLALLAGLCFMSFAAIFIKAAEAPGVVTTFYRMAVGTCFLVIPFSFSLVTSKKINISLKGVLLAVIAGVCFGFDMGLWSTGVVLSNATIPTLTANLAPVWVGFGTILIFKKKQRIGFWLGVFVAILGMGILVHKDITSGSNLMVGAVLGIAAGVFYAIFYLISETGRKILNTLHFLFISTASSAMVLGVMVIINNYSLTGYSRETYLLFLGIGLGVQVAGWYLISFSQGHLPATTVAPTLLGQPVFTFLWAAWLLNEQLTKWHILGGGVVITGIYMVHYFRNKNK